MPRLLVGLFVLVVAACSSSPTDDDGDPPDNPDPPPPGTVFVEPTSFRPATITITAGNTVTWDNVVADAHTITPINHAAFSRVEVTSAIAACRLDS